MSGAIITGGEGSRNKTASKNLCEVKSLYFTLFMLSPSISLMSHFLFTLPHHAKMRHNLQATTPQDVQ